MSPAYKLLLKVRPAPLGSFLAHALGLSKRRLVHTKHGVFFVNPISDLGSTLLETEYEPQMRSLLAQYLRPGSVFVDMGANEGYFSVLASRLVGPTGTVISVEPQTRLQNVIEKNLGVNGCYNVRLAQVAIFSSTDKMHLSLAPDTNTGSSSLFRQTRYVVPKQEVQTLSLRDFLERYGIHHCDLMKVDIEGAEYDAFMGAEDVLRQGLIKHIALEIHDSILARRGLDPEALHRHLISCGYELEMHEQNRVYSFRG